MVERSSLAVIATVSPTYPRALVNRSQSVLIRDLTGLHWQPGEIPVTPLHLVVFTHALARLVVDNNIEKRTVNRQPSTVVINETQLPEFVHEEADP